MWAFLRGSSVPVRTTVPEIDAVSLVLVGEVEVDAFWALSVRGAETKGRIKARNCAILRGDRLMGGAGILLHR